MFYIERWGGQITEVREKPITPVQDVLAKLRLTLSRWHLPGGYSFKLAALERNDEYTPHQVIFADFKASAKPAIADPECGACDRPLRWKPGHFSFTGAGSITDTVTELGWWKCSDGHPGEIDPQDFDRYVKAGDQFREYLQGIYGQYEVKYGRIMPKAG